jgi:hypothetical protein
VFLKMEDSVMTRRIGLLLIAIAAFASVVASADNAEARHRRGRGSCGSWGGNGSYGGGGSFGGFFSRRNNGSSGSYGGNGSHGGSYQNNSCGSHGGSYQVVEESAPQAASIEGSQGEVRYYGQRDEGTYDSGQSSSRTRMGDRDMRAGAGAAIGSENRDARDRNFNERRDTDARGQRQDLQGERRDSDAQDSQRAQGEQRSTDNQRQSQDNRDTGQDSNRSSNQNLNENQDRNDNQQPPPPPSGT